MSYEKLKQAAEAASPGPWRVGGSNGRMIYDAQNYLCGDSDLLVNATYKAAANPAAILALLASHAALLEALENVTITAEFWYQDATGGDGFKLPSVLGARAAIAQARAS